MGSQQCNSSYFVFLCEPRSSYGFLFNLYRHRKRNCWLTSKSMYLFLSIKYSQTRKRRLCLSDIQWKKHRSVRNFTMLLKGFKCSETNMLIIICIIFYIYTYIYIRSYICEVKTMERGKNIGSFVIDRFVWFDQITLIIYLWTYRYLYTLLSVSSN